MCLTNANRLSLCEGQVVWASRSKPDAVSEYLMVCVTDDQGRYAIPPTLVRTPYRSPHDPRLFWRQGANGKELWVNFAYYANWVPNRRVQALWRQAEARLVLGRAAHLEEVRPLPLPSNVDQHKNVFRWDERWLLYHVGRQEVREAASPDTGFQAGPHCSQELRGGALPIVWDQQTIASAHHYLEMGPRHFEYYGSLGIQQRRFPFSMHAWRPIDMSAIRRSGVPNRNRYSRWRFGFIVFPTTLERQTNEVVVLAGVQDSETYELRFPRSVLDEMAPPPRSSPSAKARQ